MIIHCDQNLRNLLLDENLDLVLADFQGMLKSADGEILLGGLCRECTKSYMPRTSTDFAGVETDIFELQHSAHVDRNTKIQLRMFLGSI